MQVHLREALLGHYLPFSSRFRKFAPTLAGMLAQVMCIYDQTFVSSDGQRNG
jgi:hypothetical protein